MNVHVDPLMCIYEALVAFLSIYSIVQNGVWTFICLAIVVGICNRMKRTRYQVVNRLLGSRKFFGENHVPRMSFSYYHCYTLLTISSTHLPTIISLHCIKCCNLDKLINFHRNVRCFKFCMSSVRKQWFCRLDLIYPFLRND